MSREWILETISCSYGRAESCVRDTFRCRPESYHASEFVPPRVTGRRSSKPHWPRQYARGRW